MAGSDVRRDHALNVIIVGAGIGGLAAAVALSRSLNGAKDESPNSDARIARHQITVLERHSSLQEVGAGVQIPPNASRILCSWGLRPAFEAIAAIPDAMEIRRSSDHEPLGRVPQNFQHTSEKNYGAPHWTVHRGDYQSVLGEAAVREGVDIKFSQRVSSVDAERNEVVIDGPEQKRLNADLIVGADGLFSKVRRSMTANEGIEPFDGGEFVYRYLVPREKMLQNALTAKLMDGKEAKMTFLWSGPGKAMMGYPVSAGRLYNVLGTIPRPSGAPLGAYNAPGNPDEMRELFLDFDETCQALLGHCGPDTDGCAKWTLSDMQELKSWKTESGQTVLLGDAAHNMLPWAASGASTSIEDAAVLASSLSHFLESGQNKSKQEIIASTAELYERTRKPRATRMQQVSRENQYTFTLPNGPIQEARDAKLKAVMQQQEQRLKEGKEIVERNLTKPDINAKFPSPEAQMYMYGYDAVKAFEEELKRYEEEK